MTNSRQKGNKRERQAESYYKQSGYKTEICRGLRWGRTDWFGLFDLMAVKNNKPVRFVQVKSNQVSDVSGWIEDARRFCDPEFVALDYLVCHDYVGWRLIRPDGGTNYRVVLDEREQDCNMGEGVIEYLRREE